jgi:hypothetical protein
MKTFIIRCCLFVLFTTIATYSRAEMITLAFNFEAREFTGFQNSSVPVDIVAGSFAVSFDNSISTPATLVPDFVSLSILDQSYGRLDSLVDISLNSPERGLIILGGVRDGAAALSGFTNDFQLILDGPLKNPDVAFFIYTTASSRDVFSARTVTLNAVPAPSSFVLFMAGGCVLLFVTRSGRFGFAKHIQTI